MTKVVNIRKTPSYDVYIGRAGRGKDGYFGNPIQKDHRCIECGQIHRDHTSVVLCYQFYLARRLKKDPVFRQRVKQLSGKTLGCFCKPDLCHGDILARIADKLNTSTDVVKIVKQNEEDIL